MDKQFVITQVRAQEAALRALGVRTLALFGSWATNQQQAGSDVDLLYEFEEGEATLDHFLDLSDLLEKTLQRPVDLVPAKYVSPHLTKHIEQHLMPILDPASAA